MPTIVHPDSSHGGVPTKVTCPALTRIRVGHHRDSRPALPVLPTNDMNTWTLLEAMIAHHTLQAFIAVAVTLLLVLHSRTVRAVDAHDVSYARVALALGIPHHPAREHRTAAQPHLLAPRMDSTTISPALLRARPNDVNANANDVTVAPSGSTATSHHSAAKQHRVLRRHNQLPACCVEVLRPPNVVLE